MFVVETVRWTNAENKSGKCYQGVLKAAESFMVRWHYEEAKKSRKRYASTMSGVKGKRGGGGGDVLSLRIAVVV